jgi:hypothetical protein
MKLIITTDDGHQLASCIWNTETTLNKGTKVVALDETYVIESITEFQQHYIIAVGKKTSFEEQIVDFNADIKEGDTIVLKNDKRLVVTGFALHLNMLFVKCGDYTCKGTNIKGVLLSTPEQVREYNEKLQKITEGYKQNS